VAANADVFGFDLAAGTLGDIRIPAFHGADTNNQSGTRLVDSTAMPVLEFVNNESYGSLQTGAAIGWNADVRGFRAWHTSRHGLTATPADKLSLDSLIVRGDKSILADEFENPAGVWVGNYVSKTVLVRNADVEGMRTGVASPFFRQDQKPEPGRGEGVLTIEDSRFRDYIGVVVATAYRSISNNDKPVKRAIVRSSLFELLPIAPLTGFPPAAVSMNYRMASGDANPRDPIFIYDFNRVAGDNFALYYSLEAPKTTAPCNETRPDLDGWVCSSVP
jgi:hypothetical protein